MNARILLGLMLGAAFFGQNPITAADLPPSPPTTFPGATAESPLPPPPQNATVVAVSQEQVSLPQGVSLSGWVGELVRLAEAGIGEDVLLSFVDSAGTFNLNSDQIVYLHDIGVSSEVIATIIRHDVEIAAGLRQVTAGAPPVRLTFTKVQKAPAADLESKPKPVSAKATVMRSEPEEGWFDSFVWFDALPEPEAPGSIFPVREPFAVQLTSPIVVFRAWGRPANTTLLRTLP